jgi:hypothetical protein
MTCLANTFPSAPLHAEDKSIVSLVRAKVVKIESGTPEAGIPATLEISVVYSGDRKLAGKTFTDVYRQQDANGVSASSPFELGEEGVWTLKQTEKGLLPSYDWSMPFAYRSRKADWRHTEIVALAETIGKCDTAKPEERENLLRALVKDRTPEVSAWAVHAIGDSKTATARVYLDSLAQKIPPDFPIASQVALDEVLTKTKESDWTKSKVRSTLLESCVSGKPDEYHMNLILRRFDMADQLDQLSNKTAIELTRRAAENKEWARRFRLFAVEQVGRIAGRGVNDEPAYTWLFEQVRNNADVEFRRVAAGTLAGYIVIYPGRLKSIEEQLQIEMDKDVIKSLQEAVKKGKSRK